MLTTIGIVIGVASVTAVIAALTGLKAKVLSDFESFGTNKIYINPKQLDNVSWQNIRFKPHQFDRLLEHCPSVKALTLQSWGAEHTIKYNERSEEGVRVYGIQPSWHEIENRPLLLGRPLSVIDEEKSHRVCLIGPNLRDELRLDRDCIGEFIMIGHRTFRVIGVLEPRPEMSMIGEGGRKADFEIFIPFSTNLKLERYSWIWALASSKSTDVTEEAQAEIKFFLRRTRRIKPGEPDNFRVMSVESEIKKFNEIAIMITLVASGIVGISLLVGGVGIMNIMLVSVSERTREIGLRKAVGARKSSIMAQFLVEAVVLCFIGGFVGIGFGQLLTNGIAKMNPMLDKTYIPFWAILLSFGFSGFVGIFFGMFPAIKAARLDPIEALRHE